MRWIALFPLALLTSCNGDVCGGGTCIDLRVDTADPNVTKVDQLELRVLGAATYTGKTSSLGTPVPLPVTTDISIPDGRTGTVWVAVNGLLNAAVVGEGMHAIAIKPGMRTTLTVHLTSKPQRRVFLLPPRNGQLGGQMATDMACSMAAQTAGLSGKYKALLGYSGVVGPSGLVMLDDGDREIVLPDNTLVASDGDFLQPNHIHAIDQGPAKERPTSECVWTNFEADGMYRTADCSGWTSQAVGQRGNFGEPDKSDVLWANFGGNRTCDALCHVYCIEQ
jgi:hypothetical protein